MVQVIGIDIYWGLGMNKFIVLSIFILIFSCLVSICLGPNVDEPLFLVPSLPTVLLFRLPRVLLGILVGIGLALSGASLQSLLRNELASPYTLGISSAGALGASIAIFCQLPVIFISFLAMGFSFAALLFIVFIYYRQSQGSREYVLLVGVSLGFLCSSLIVGMQFFGGAEISFSIQKWLIGSLQTVGFSTCIILAPVVLFSLFVLCRLSRTLDILQLGSDFSLAKGVDVHQVNMEILIVIALLVGMLVSLVGPIAFVGLLVPQVVKLYVDSLHRYVLWYSAVYGAVFLIIVDSLSRVLIAPSEIPVGVLSSLIGAPIFVGLLLSKR